MLENWFKFNHLEVRADPQFVRVKINVEKFFLLKDYTYISYIIKQNNYEE